MRFYLQAAIFLCRLTATPISYLLHPLDLIGGDQLPELRFFPGMKISSDQKLNIFTIALKSLQKKYSLAPMGKHATHLLNDPEILAKKTLKN